MLAYLISQQFWRRGPNGMAQKPTEISKFWYHLPVDSVDALYERMDGTIIFFKGVQQTVDDQNI